MAVMEVVIRAIDQASDVVAGIADNTRGAFEALEVNWVAITAGATAAGLGIEKFAREQAPLTEQTNRLSAALGVNRQEVRDLAVELTDVTRPLTQVLDTMEIGRQQGIKNIDQLRDYVVAWDTVGDATGENAAEMARASTSLRAFGLETDNITDAYTAFGYIQQETTIGVTDFLGVLNRIAPELGNVNMSLDDAAAIVGILQHEFGVSGEMLKRTFSRAIRESDGDLGGLLETLGITEAQFAQYRGAVDEASGVIERNAALHGEGYTAMQKLESKASVLSYEYGNLIGVMSGMVPILLAIGPAIKIVSVAKSGLVKVLPLIGKGIMAFAGFVKAGLIPALAAAAKAAIAFGAALLANPITWIILAIIALIVIIVLLVKNWDKVKDFLINIWEIIKEKAIAIWEGLKEFFTNLWEGIKEAFSAAWEYIKNLFLDNTLPGLIIKNWDTIKEKTVEIWNGIKEFFANLWEWIKSFFAEWGPAILAVLVPFIGIPLLIAQHWDTIKEFATELWETIKSKFQEGVESVKQTMAEKWAEVVETTQNTWETIKEGAQVFWDWFRELGGGSMGELVDTINEYLQNMMEGIRIVWEAIKEFWTYIWEAIKALFRGDLEAVKANLQSAMSTMQNLINTIWNAISTFLTNIWESIKNTISQKIEAIRANLATTWENIRTQVTQTMENIRNFLIDTWENIKQAVTQKAQELRQAVIDTVDRAMQFIRDLPSKAAGWGAAIMQGLVQGIRSQSSAVWGAIKGVVTDAIERIKDFLGMESPSRVFAAIGENISKGTAKGIRDGTKEVNQAIGAMVAIPGGLTGTAGGSEREGEAKKITLDMRGFFDGAHVTMTSEADIQSLAREIYKMVRSQARSEGVLI